MKTTDKDFASSINSVIFRCFVLFAVLIGGGALLDQGGHSTVAWVLIIVSGTLLVLLTTLIVLALFGRVKGKSAPDCVKCGMPGRKQLGPSWSVCVVCGEKRVSE